MTNEAVATGVALVLMLAAAALFGVVADCIGYALVVIDEKLNRRKGP